MFVVFFFSLLSFRTSIEEDEKEEEGKKFNIRSQKMKKNKCRI